MTSPRPLLVTTGLTLVALTGACGQNSAAATVGGALAQSTVRTPAPVPVVEPTCSALYPHYTDARDLVAHADLIVRVTATGPSRDYEQYPLVPTSDGSYVSALEQATAEELEQRGVVATPGTAITVRVEEVLKGAAGAGDVLEVDQNRCSPRPLPVGDGVQYLMALEDLHLDPKTPLNQLNDSQATWQVAADRTLVPVDPDNDLGIASVDHLAGLAQ